MDQRVWWHMFPNTLDDFPKKWHKLEEDRGQPLKWSKLKIYFIKYFDFQLEEKPLVKATQQIKKKK